MKRHIHFLNSGFLRSLTILLIVQQPAWANSSWRSARDAGTAPQTETGSGGTNSGGGRSGGSGEARNRGPEYITLVAQQQVDHIEDRRDEVRRGIMTLMNPERGTYLLVGEIGIGRSTVANAIIGAIQNGQAPADLQGRQIFQLNIEKLFTDYKDAKELLSRMSGVIEQVEKANGILLVNSLNSLDRLETVDGPFSVLKNALVARRIKCIAVATPGFYDKKLKTDPAFMSRAHIETVSTLSDIAIETILRQHAERLERETGVQVRELAIQDIPRLMRLYVPRGSGAYGSESPMREILFLNDLVREAQMNKLNGNSAVDKLHTEARRYEGQVRSLSRSIQQIRESVPKGEQLDSASLQEVQVLEKQLATTQEALATTQKEAAEIQSMVDKSSHLHGDIDRLKDLRLRTLEAFNQAEFAKQQALSSGNQPDADRNDGVANQIRQRYDSINDEILRLSREANTNAFQKVDRLSVVVKIHQITDIPMTFLSQTAEDRMTNLRTELENGVYGQPRAIDTVNRAVRRASARINPAGRKKPIGSFLFIGPTGVGKTETAKVLQKALFGGGEFGRIDMTEYGEKHSVSRLIGAPPGYVGYDQGGVLTEMVRQKPYQVILIDEIEKAHPDVFNIFMQVMDEARLTDGQGRTVDFSGTIIIITSNAAAEVYDSKPGTPQRLALEAQLEAQTGWNREKAGLMDKPDAVYEEHLVREVLIASGKFKREWLARLTDLVSFNRLDDPNIAKKVITKALRERRQAVWDDRGVNLYFSEDVVNRVFNEGFSEQNGARLVEKYLDSHVFNLLSDLLLEHPPQQGDHIIIHSDPRSSGDTSFEVFVANKETAAEFVRSEQQRLQLQSIDLTKLNAADPKTVKGAQGAIHEGEKRRAQERESLSKGRVIAPELVERFRTFRRR